ncbi:uncharacterized protein B0P05DRAFT_565253 [Gilbertella persicaria]|uniref:uncharacterized protein n=1 Tax=Gilbertella persicaria TaxID=101096 RepID=UPI0022209ABE|nr:uncharacterized protein B0P05DRAFT_565253 [Gilbertella persicaria]KAI8047842.1 hypothetical protein B0P05DRAFT_565253 [Gilbertella persicaria]
MAYVYKKNTTVHDAMNMNCQISPIICAQLKRPTSFLKRPTSFLKRPTSFLKCPISFLKCPTSFL